MPQAFPKLHIAITVSSKSSFVMAILRFKADCSALEYNLLKYSGRAHTAGVALVKPLGDKLLLSDHKFFVFSNK